MAFDPKAYLREKRGEQPAGGSSAFDPKAYLAEKRAEWGPEGPPSWLTPGSSPAPEKNDWTPTGSFEDLAFENQQAKDRLASQKSFPRRAVESLDIRDPAKRRNLERGISDVVTLGLAEKIAGAIEKHVGNWGLTGERLPDMESNEQIAADDAAAPMSRTAGQVIGTMMPGVGRGLGRLAMNPVTRLAGATGSRVLGPVVGALGAAAAAPVIAGTMAGGRSLVEGEVAGAPRAAWDAAKATVQDPAAMVAAGAMGAAGGYAAGLRGGNTRTGQDIRTVQEAGAEPSPTGPRGGAYEEAPIAGRRGTTENQAEVARESAKSIARREGQRFDREVGQPYKETLERMNASGADQALIPTEDIAVTSAKLMQSEAVSAPVKGYIQREVIDVLNRYRDMNRGQYAMPAGKLNELRQKLSDAAKTGTSEVPRGTRQIRELSTGAKEAVDTSDYGKLNAPYSAGKAEATKSLKQLGVKGGKTSKIDVDRIDVDPKQELHVKRIADRLFRQGEGARLTGQERADLADFLKRHPEYTDEVLAAPRMAAGERLRFRLPEGGLLPSVQGTIAANIEPIEGVLYRAGRGVARPAGPVQAAIAARRQNRERAEKLRKAQGR